jgi:hypothetical protein
VAVVVVVAVAVAVVAAAAAVVTKQFTIAAEQSVVKLNYYLNREEVTVGRRKLHIEELHNLHSSQMLSL